MTNNYETSNKNNKLELNENLTTNDVGFSSKRLDGMGLRLRFKSYQVKEEGRRNLCLISIIHSLRVEV